MTGRTSPASTADLAREWVASFTSDLAELSARIDAASAEDVFRFSHNTRALAATFGYELVGEIAGRLAARLRDAEGAMSEADHALARAGLAAFDFVMTHDLRGDGGDAGRAILAKLDALAAA